MIARLTMISHAPTSALKGAFFPDDEPIEGKTITAQCQAISQTLRKVDRSWTAPELRTRQTANALGLSAEIAPVLSDCDYGAWRGVKLSDIQAREPKGLAAWLSNAERSPHGGETISNVLHRVGAWLSDYREPGHTVALTHPAVIRAAIVHILNAPPQAFWRIDVEPLSITDLRRNSAHWTLRSTGRVVIDPGGKSRP